MLKFEYTDNKGKHSHRVVFPIVEPGDSYLAIDLSEFDEDEQKAYAEELKMIEEQVKELWSAELDRLGLKHNWRRFKTERMENVEND